jgi:ketosteroid isomerase-like protein
MQNVLLLNFGKMLPLVLSMFLSSKSFAMKTKNLLTLTILLLGCCCYCLAQGSPKPQIKMPKDSLSLLRLSAIDRDVWHPFISAYAAGTAEKYEALHTEDFVRAMPDNIFGKAESLVSSQRHFNYNRVNGRTCTIAFSFFERTVSETLASERGIYRYTSINNDGSKTDHYGKFHVIHRLVAGRWMIAMDYDSDEDGTIGKADFEAGIALK